MSNLLAQGAAGTGRARIIDLVVAAQRPMTVQDVAMSSGLHVNTVREHLERLVTEGLLTREVPSTGRPGRPQVIYARAADAEVGRRSYQELAGLLAEHLVAVSDDPSAEAREIGSTWGRALALEDQEAEPGQPEDELARVLGSAGFAPTVEEGCVAMRNCPFHELAELHPEVACSLHEGMLRAYLEQRGIDDVRPRLRPWVAPGVCEVHLHRD